LKEHSQGPREEKAKVPAYVVTFSDMVTLLLTFFVLLLTLAKVQDEEMFNQGRDSFLESIKDFGLGALLGKQPTIDFDAKKVKNLSPEPDTSDDRAIDAYREKLRRVFEHLTETMTTLPSQIVGRRLDFAITNVRFTSGQAILNDASREYLSGYCTDLQENLTAEACTLYVLGLAGDEATEKRQWMLSARRAQAVAGFLKEQLAQDAHGRPGSRAPADAPGWRVLWWGAGPGGNWAGQDQPDPGQSQVLIAVLRAGA
jgi:chemotaxis protein MotB